MGEPTRLLIQGVFAQMSLIILRECNIGITSGDADLWLDTVSELSLNNTTARTLLAKRNLFHSSNAQVVLHKNNDTTTGTFTCYLTDEFEESLLFLLLGCEVYEDGFVVPTVLPDTVNHTPAKFLIASGENAYEVSDVVVTSITFPLGKGYAGEIQVSFEGGEMVQVPRKYNQVISNSQGKHFPVRPLELIFDDVTYQPISANINIAQNIHWSNNQSIYDNFNVRRPVVVGHSVNITTTQYHKKEPILPSFENIRIKQGGFELSMEQASITRRIGVEEDIVTLSCDIQPSSHMPIIQII